MLARSLRLALGLLAVPLAAGPALAADHLMLLSGTGEVARVEAATGVVTPVASITGLPPGVYPAGFERVADGAYYLTTYPEQAGLYRLDPVTWQATLVGPLGLFGIGDQGLSIAADGTAYVLDFPGATQTLQRVDLTTGVPSVVTALQSTSPYQDTYLRGSAARSDGKLVALNVYTRRWMEVDPATGAVTPIADAPFTPGSHGGLTVQDDVGYYVTAGSAAAWPAGLELVRFDPFTGVVSDVTPLTGDVDPFGYVSLARGYDGVRRAYCFGDGAEATCPCGNLGSATSGCANSTGAGATLAGLGSNGVALDELRLLGGGLPPGTPALLFVGTQEVAGGAGALFGDGLRCVGGPILRLGVQASDAGGAASWGPGLSAQGAWSGGDTRRFQVWYRDPAGPCSTGFNLSHGLEVVFAP